MRIAHSHGAGLRDSPGKAVKLCLHRLGTKLWSSSITDFLACSHNAAEFLFPKKQKYQWIPNGIETRRFRFQPASREAERRALGLAGNTLLIGSVGRLSQEKNHIFLLKVFYELKKIRQDSVLLIVGTGCLEKRLRSQAQELGVEKDVIFYGTSSQVERLLWAMDVFVFPSHMEGLGIAGVEAQAAGLPVLASENIPVEACVTELFQEMPLSFGSEKWAHALLARQDHTAKREAGATIVQEAGFDVQTVAERIREIWMR